MNNAIVAEWRRLYDAWGPLVLLLLSSTMLLLPVVPSAAVVCAYVGLLVLATKNRFRWNTTALWRTSFPYMMVFALLHVIGLLWTSNMGFGLFDLQIKLPLLILPALVCVTAIQVRIGRGLLSFLFTLSCAVMVVVSTAAAIWRIAVGSPLSPSQEIFSSYWSLALHPSYFALYLSLAIAAWCLLPVHQWVPRGLSLLVLLVLNLGVVLCASKIGWLLLPVLLVSLMVFARGNSFVRHMLTVMLAVAVVGVTTLVIASPYARDRVAELLRASSEETHDPSATTSSAVRWLTWSTAWELFTEAPLHGTGTGDIKDELVAAYERQGFTGAAEKRLNAHSQYLQSAATLGVFAALCLLAIVLVPLVTQRDALSAIFLLLCVLNWTVESMLEVQAGSVFFAVFAVLLFWKDEPVHLRASIPPKPLE